DNGHDVALWRDRKQQVVAMNAPHKNEKNRAILVPEPIQALHDLKEAVTDKDAVVIVVPTTAITALCRQLNDTLKHPVTLVHASKGIEPESLKRVSQMISEEMNDYRYEDIVVLSGPSHAEEVAQRQPTTVTVSSVNIDQAEIAQDLF